MIHQPVGICPACGADRLLAGPLTINASPVCGPCAGIDKDVHCSGCGSDAGRYRGTLCIRCALREDLNDLCGTQTGDTPLASLVDTLCACDRPESILIWKRSSKVQTLLRSLGDGTIPFTHGGLDATPGRATEHLRALLQHHRFLPPCDPYLPRFEQWIDTKLNGLPGEVHQPVLHFATWHHLRRIRAKATAGDPTQSAIHAAKQEITETIKFLLWLHQTYQRTAATCTQIDVDEWLASGPTTRTAIRTFFVVANNAGLNTEVMVPHRVARTSPSLTQAQRLALIHELITGEEAAALPYRVAGILLLLYAQPLVRIVALEIDAIDDAPEGMSITLGDHPTDVPEPFAQLLRRHIKQRPNLRTGAGSESRWLFPSTLAGRHLHPATVMSRLRDLGINLLGARNRAITELVLDAPPSVVAQALGYSPKVAFIHADKTAEPWARYTGLRIRGTT